MAASCALLGAAAVRGQDAKTAPAASGLLDDWSVDSALAYYHENGRIQAIEPVVVVAKTAEPSRMLTPLAIRVALMSADWASANPATRPLTTPTSTSTLSGSIITPRVPAASTAVRPPADAMKVFDGTQSDSTQAPPTPSFSINVTLAPYWTATSAAS